MRAYAVIPPILLDERRRGFRYDNQNGVFEDPLGDYKEHKNVNIWTEQELDIFREKYLQHPKNFVVISSYLDRKTTSDCISNYYLTKKKENYKGLVKRRLRRPRKNPAQPQQETLPSGVTTRGSAAAQKELMKNGQPVNGASQPASPAVSESWNDNEKQNESLSELREKDKENLSSR